ncbi:ATP-binding protein [Streptococcus uberis]|uniref:ATP-binding protein n=1 Tax=Streptococcus uberis TaxID=1349 RepID=UPI001939C0DF|nr:ATP-binding protein [Streptococcus uberis]
MKKISFNNDDKVGTVIYVDTNQVLIEVEDNNQISLVKVGSIVAIETTRTYEFTIGIIEKVRRKANELIESVDSVDSVDLEETMYLSSDVVQVSLIGTYKTVEGFSRNIFKRGIDTFPQITHNCYSINSENLNLFMNIISDKVTNEKQLVIGQFAIDSKATAILDGNKFFQRHASILGSTGSGKSWCVASLVEEANKLESPNIIVLDMHGEYKSLCDTDEKIADYFKIAGPGDLNKYDSKYIFLPYWLLNRDEMLSMILDRSDTNAPNQASRFTHHVRLLKETTLKDSGKEKVLNSFTVDSPIPYELNQLITELKTDNTQKGVGKNGPVKGEWEGKLTRFISRLETKVLDKRYGFLFQPHDKTLEYGWLSEMVCNLIGFEKSKKGIKVIDFSEVPADVLPIVTGLISRILFDVQLWMNEENRTPFTILCDEAHLYLPTKVDADSVQKQALGNFERIAKEGRKYGLSLVVVSQRPSDVSKTILSQCNNFIVLRLSNDKDKLVIRNLLPDALKGILDQLPLLEVGEAIAVGDAILLPSRIKLKEPKLKPISATKNFWVEWDQRKPDNNAILEAVENMRSQTKG